MKKMLCYLSLVIVIICSSAFNHQSQVPDELIGKWNLRAIHSKLIGTLEIKADGNYSFIVAPNYNEAGILAFSERKNPQEINMIVRSRGSSGATIRGIYTIRNGTLELCLGKMNEARPLAFSYDGNRSVYWRGTK